MNTIVTQPDYLPARMVNEFVYCPRLFYYEWVEGVFAHNRETVEGSIRHAKLDSKEDELPDPQAIADGTLIHSRSVTLANDRLRLIAKIDLLESAGGSVCPVDYKRGAPPKSKDDGPLEAWDTDQAQLAVQALILRENGYRCDDGVIYYSATKQRVRVPMTDELIRETRDAVVRAFETAAGSIPPPLVDSPKCPRCSLVTICLPDETNACLHAGQERGDAEGKAAAGTDDIRRLVPARDDLRPLYLNTQGYSVGKSGSVLQVREKGKLVQEVRMNEISQLNLYGGIQLSTQALQSLCEAEIPIAYFSHGSWFYGLTTGLGLKNVFLRRDQFRKADDPEFCLQFARSLVAGKIRNQRTMLGRNHIEPPAGALARLKCYIEDAEQAGTLETLLGIEGNAARVYFEHFGGMIKIDDDAGSRSNGRNGPSAASSAGDASSSAASGDASSEESNGRGGAAFDFDFNGRNRRPPRDPVNALLSLAYSVLAKDLTNVCHAVGFDPFIGYYHQLRFGRPALALDLMEPMRPLIADSAVLTAINTKMVTSRDFLRVGPSVALTADGRKAFFRAYEQRMDTLVTHPLFGYRVNYRRILEIQARLLARFITEEIEEYPVFVTR
jgi:CRISP-associated protein Cas1